MKKKRTDRIDVLQANAAKALKEAVAEAIAQHKLLGVPAVIWRNGKVVYLPGRRLKGHRG